MFLYCGTSLAFSIDPLIWKRWNVQQRKSKDFWDIQDRFHLYNENLLSYGVILSSHVNTKLWNVLFFYLTVLSLILRVATFLIIFHFLKREIESLFVHRFSTATMPIVRLLINCSHYWFVSLLFHIFYFDVKLPGFSLFFFFVGYYVELQLVTTCAIPNIVHWFREFRCTFSLYFFL